MCEDRNEYRCPIGEFSPNDIVGPHFYSAMSLGLSTSSQEVANSDYTLFEAMRGVPITYNLQLAH